MQEKQEAASKIQAVQRGKQARREQREREEAAVKIQSVHRGRTSRKSPEQKERQDQLNKIRTVWNQMIKGTRNNGEWVGASEVLKGFKLLGAKSMTMEEAQALSRHISKNKDGRVRKAEFESYCMQSLTEKREKEKAKRSKAEQLNRLQEKDRRKSKNNRGGRANRRGGRRPNNNPRSPQSPKLSPTPPPPRRRDDNNNSSTNQTNNNRNYSEN